MLEHITNLNNSKIFIGLTMIIVNLGSKYIIEELSNTQKELFKNTIVRRIVLFTVIFIATKDIKISFILTAAFIIFVSGLFNENSKFCIYKFNGKCYSEITEDAYNEAKKIVEKYQEDNNN